jgi:Ca2+-transporting ATPase
LIAAVTFGWFAWRLGEGAALEIVRTETFTVLAMCKRPANPILAS